MTVTTDRPILVTGATGQQGGATARHLLDARAEVRALVRDPESPRAAALRAAGAELAVGDLTDRASLDAALSGVHGVFSVQPTTGSGAPADETRMGFNVAEAAAAAGVEHLVYSSVGAVQVNGRGTGWQPKLEIEQRIAEFGLPATVLRPVMFMENHPDPRIGIRSELSALRLAPDHVRIQLIAVDDIGAFAAIVFGDPDRHLGRAYELAGDELTKRELAAKITAATGIAPDLTPPAERPRLGFDLDAMIRNNSFGGWSADIPALRAIHPGLKTYDTWLAAGGAAAFRRLLASPATPDRSPDAAGGAASR